MDTRLALSWSRPGTRAAAAGAAPSPAPRFPSSPRSVWRPLAAAFAAAWRFVREVSGDAAYDTYARRAGAGALSREDFWLDALRRRYDRISRCC